VSSDPYTLSARVYDVIYGGMKDYVAEAERALALIEEYSYCLNPTVLSAACGTGLHDVHFWKRFKVEGMDLSPHMLTIAGERLPYQTFYRADMTTFELGKRYRAVTCMFSAIGHVLGYHNLCKAMERMAAHLECGGVLLVEPWLHPDMYVAGKLHVTQVETPELTVVRVARSFCEGNVLRLVMDHFLSRDGRYEEPFTEEILAEMYTVEQYLAAMRAAGLEAWHIPGDDPRATWTRGTFVGRKNS
jgi:ubiquinone/menaquinone biosynthesis C-methylase UbiE